MAKHFDMKDWYLRVVLYPYWDTEIEVFPIERCHTCTVEVTYPICKKILKSRDSHRHENHQSKSKCKRPSKCPCSVCGKLLHERYIRTHELECHTENEKNKTFRYNICDKVFKLEMSVNCHKEAVHCKTMNIMCEKCGASYNSKTTEMRYEKT